MKFGHVADPEKYDLTLPGDEPETERLLTQYGTPGPPDVRVGCSRWTREALPGFFPEETEDELAYYSSQFNSIELNPTFYRIFGAERVRDWYRRASEDFAFAPKVNRQISHSARLGDVESLTDRFVESVGRFGSKLGTCFVQMPESFGPENFERLREFVEYWPSERVALAVELRNSGWYETGSPVRKALFELLEEEGIASLITATAGRRDLLHMRLTAPEAFVRFVGSNHDSDKRRLERWARRLARWSRLGLDRINFFVHQNGADNTPELAAYFIEELNDCAGTALAVPRTNAGQFSLW